MPFVHDHKRPQVWWRAAEKLTYKSGLRKSIFTKFNDRYIGDWQRNVKEGKGAFLSRSGQQYEGDWERDYRHGYGVLSRRLPDKTFELVYAGEWVNGIPYGHGTKYYPGGGVYIGRFKNGKRHGFGRMWYKDGSYYEGEWKNDLHDGIGMFVQVNGNRYEGAFSKGKKHGKGRFYHLDNGVLQEGVWHLDICKCSKITVIPYRQSAIEPTEYSFLPIKLTHRDKVLYDQEDRILRGDIDDEVISIASDAS